MSAFPKTSLPIRHAREPIGPRADSAPAPVRLAGADAPPAGLPDSGVVLVGTAATVRQLAGHIAHLNSPCVPAGCILLNRFDNQRDTASPFSGILPPVLGFADELSSLHERYGFRMALVCIPSGAALSQHSARLRLLFRELNLPARFVPTYEELLLGHGAVSPAPAHVNPDSIDPVALIGRRGATIDHQQVGRVLRGKRVLITGAGGSIGGRLALEAAAFDPECIILVERAENALFSIDQALARRFPNVPRRAILHDVVDAEPTRRLLAELRPHAVYHAAAHKHVPLMEDHPGHALRNNLVGTRSIVDASILAGAERFVMISSDKAVNPTSIMGATKRLAELYVGGMAAASDTRLSMVRFGNVLASACSVIPIWSQQLADGGPLTVTDPRMTRYFMTIPEAAALVVQASALDQPAGRAPVYVLNMGQPIRIVDLAVRFVRLHGYEPRIDAASLPAGADLHSLPDPDDQPDAASVSIVFTGARPGEKLFEQLAYDAEQLRPTAHQAISQWSAAVAPDTAAAQAMADDLARLCSPTADKSAVVSAIKRFVPEMVRA